LVKNGNVLSDVEEFQVELVNPEYEQISLSLSETKPLEDELVNEDDEFPEIVCFTSHLHIKNIIHSSVPIEYLSTSPKGIATIFHVADWTDQNHAWKNYQYPDFQ
ncbi:2530_t:CDS:2, partial [Dentiscutata heterogama]